MIVADLIDRYENAIIPKWDLALYEHYGTILDESLIDCTHSLTKKKPLELLREMVGITYSYGIDRKFDAWWLFCGETGKGKSMGLLHAMEEAFKIIKKAPDIKRVAQNNTQIGEAFGDADFKEPIGFDEAVELDARRGQENMNVTLSQAAVVCRVYGNFVCVAIPDPNDLEGRLRKLFRVLVYVDRRGHAYIWIGKQSVRSAMEAMKRTGDPRLFQRGNSARPEIINPHDAEEIIPDYVGPLRAGYDTRKLENAKEKKLKLKILTADISGNPADIMAAHKIHSYGGDWMYQTRTFKKETGLSAATYARYIKIKVV